MKIDKLYRKPDFPGITDKKNENFRSSLSKFMATVVFTILTGMDDLIMIKYIILE